MLQGEAPRQADCPVITAPAGVSMQPGVGEQGQGAYGNTEGSAEGVTSENQGDSV